MNITKKDILSVIDELDFPGKILGIHSSLKSFGPIEGSISTLINPFIERQCTLLVPTFTYMYQLPLDCGRIIQQNGCDGNVSDSTTPAGIFEPENNVISKEMGAIPAHILQMTGRRRGIHPLNSFAAVGPKADPLIEAQGYLDVYGPYQKEYQEDGYLVLMGVGLNRATPIHYAEQMAGRNLFRRWAKGPDGQTHEVAVGSCSEGFHQLDPYLKPLERTVNVGESLWIIYPFRDFIDTIVTAIKGNNRITHCGDPGCIRCNDAVNGGPILQQSGTSE